MNHLPTRRLRIMLGGLLLLGALLAACTTETAIIGEPTVLPVNPVTTTPGGVISMLLPTDPPPTAILPTTDATAPVNPLEVAEALDLPADCPDRGNPAPPEAPPAYSLYISTINRFLSDGGAIPFLESILRTWGAVGEDYGGVTDSFDLTNDGVFDVIVIVSDPFNRTVVPLPGQLLVYGCYQNNYRLLYGSDYGPGLGVPQLLYVGDMNGDAQTEFVYFQERCQEAICVQAAQVLSWSAPNDGFLALNVDTVGAAGGQFSIQDLDGDGIQEIMIRGGGAPTDISAGPPRGTTTIWDWNGLNYVRAVAQLDPPIYRIHVIHDGDRALRDGDGETAVGFYRQALENPALGTWHVPNEAAMIRAYAHYRLVLAYAMLGNTSQADDTLRRLLAENPDGTPGSAYAALGRVFWDAYQATHDLHSACLGAIELSGARPEALIFLNSYGTANPSYQAADLCPL